MARTKMKNIRISISLGEHEAEALHTMMKEDLKSDKSSYFGWLLSEEYKRRQPKERNKVGRPLTDRGVDDDDPYAYTGDPTELVCHPSYDGIGKCHSFIDRDGWYSWHLLHSKLPDPIGPITQLEYLRREQNPQA